MLRNQVIYGHSYTFQTSVHPELLYGAEIGDRIRAGDHQWPTGSMGLSAPTYAGPSRARPAAAQPSGARRRLDHAGIASR